MHSGYLRRAAVAASRTSSPAKALRTAAPVPVARAASTPALRTDAFSVEDVTAQVSPAKGSPHFSEHFVPGNPTRTEVASAEASGQQGAPVPLSAAVRKMAQPVRDSASEARREGPKALTQQTQSEAQASAMAGVLQRLSKPTTRIQAPMGLREMRASLAANAQSKAALPGADGGHLQDSGQQRGEVKIGDNVKAAEALNLQGPSQESHGLPPEKMVVRSYVAPARTMARKPGGSTPRMESVQVERDESAVVEMHNASVPGRPSMNRLEAAGQEQKTVERRAEERAVEQQISVKSLPASERAARVIPGQGEQFTAPPSAGGQNKSERKVRIGQIDVHVNNQPSPRRSSERSGAVAQKSYGAVASQDLSRFLLRY